MAARPELGLLLRAPLKETRTAADVVRRALLGAVLVALAVALVVGLALAGRLARRLRRLRDTALRVELHDHPAAVAEAGVEATIRCIAGELETRRLVG